MPPKKKSVSEDYVRMYYEHQYERMKALEEQRLSITNFVIAISALSFTFGYQKGSPLGLISVVALPVIIMFANLFAILYVSRTEKIIKVHLERAYQVLYDHVPEMILYNEKYASPKETGFESRALLQKLIHLLLILMAIISVVLYILIP